MVSQMSLDNTSLASSINAFSQVSPSEQEQVIVISISQLSDLITQAVEKAIQALQDEVESFRAIITRQDEKIAALESTQEQDVDRICLDVAYDRQRLARLERIEPQPMQKDRGDILRALLAANGGKMLAKDARQKMHLSRSRFSELMVTLKSDIEIKPYHLKRNQNILVLK
jgi:hypothetical protein